MNNFPPPELKTYRPNYNLISSFSIKHKDEDDYQEARLFLESEGISIGDYFMNAYRELDKPSFSKKSKQPFRFQTQQA